MPKKTWTLVDQEQGIHVDGIILGPKNVGGSATGYSVAKRTLRSGLSQGVEIIEVVAGDFRYVVVPTRGMGIWRASLGDFQLGWKSPVRGPVHPSFVHLDEASGIGWLDGFDELIVRCGLESMGAPEFHADGRLRYPLHGKIANLPAHKVEVTIDGDSGEIGVTGAVDEARMFGSKLRLVSTVVTRVGFPGMILRDTVTNLSAEPGDFELLYHCNFGNPLVEPGASVVAPVAKMAPRDAAAVTDLPTWNRFGDPSPGTPEAVFFFDLAADSSGRTQTLLKNAEGNRGVGLKFSTRQFPSFSLWKNPQAASDGYVAGLEPGTNFPNTKSFEKQMGRVPPLPPGETRTFEIELVVHSDRKAVEEAEAGIAALQKGVEPHFHDKPNPVWSKA